MNELDKIILQGLQFYGFHGVLPEEKANGQWFEVDLELWGDFQLAAKSDDLRLGLDYSLIYRKVKEVMEGESRNLLENVAQYIIDSILGMPLVRKVLVRVKKLHPPLGGPAAYAAIEMVRVAAND